MKLADLVDNNKVINLDTLSSDKELVQEIQTQLSEIGLLQMSDIDGTFSSTTKVALTRFCKAVFLDNMNSGWFGPTFAKKLIEFRDPVETDNSVDFNSPSKTPDQLITALKFTLLWEGDFVNHPNDLGGATNKGITQRTYDSYRSSKSFPTQSVKFITDEEVHEIYHKYYWQPGRAELMVLPLAVVQFDTAVLFGVGGAIKFLQQAIGVTGDGIFGPQTEAALLPKNNKETGIEMVEKRIIYHNQRVVQNPSQKVFLAGWLNRANDLRKFIDNL
ncbi:hypothetical protein IQ264_05315 [Phormidium sp. LEGE 05292]|uniref:glycoside hydrolase family 108 protein n=1 Tax=[Phormidium] sp. LEGE 05292 TaxID=767427 RepID=UPI00188263AC|nr:glycosyl hydrolase 108 family protein [Phormidium sp. LEGE 05292]MBE9224885.1 hypothetical protein [Phormidium sp. LEGE 05292]